MKHDIFEESIEGMPVIIDWDLRQQMAFVFEVPTREIEHLLPPGLQPFEVRPGVSATFLGYNDYNPGNRIYGKEQPAFVEITRFIMVHPDLSVDMPLPRFTFFVHQIASNNEDFIRQEIETLHLPSYLSTSLRVETDESKTEARAIDDDGPVQDLINTNSKVVYREEEFYGQYYTVQDGKLYFGVWYWSGDAFIHQKRGAAGGIHPHPFLNGLEKTFAPELAEKPYMQIISKFGAPAVQIFYQPRLVRELDAAKS